MAILPSALYGHCLLVMVIEQSYSVFIFLFNGKQIDFYPSNKLNCKRCIRTKFNFVPFLSIHVHVFNFGVDH